MESAIPLKDKNFRYFLGIDIGGTLAKVCICALNPKPDEIEFPENINELMIDQSKEGKRFSFHKFPSSDIGALLDFLLTNKIIPEGDGELYMTGGGAHKYEKEIESRLKLKIVKVDEMNSLAKGLEFLVRNINECRYYYNPTAGRIYLKNAEDFPFLLVNIGSGVSILKFVGYHKFTRVGGTALGGGTFLGLSHLILGENNFETLLDYASKGNNRNVDVTMEEIYKGSDSPVQHSQTHDILAVSLGKLSNVDVSKDFAKEHKPDVAKSLLYMIAYNIGQIAYMWAKKENVSNIYFAGNFIRNHTVTMTAIMNALVYFSYCYEHQVNAYFLKHDGYIGALGCILAKMEDVYGVKEIEETQMK